MLQRFIYRYLLYALPIAFGILSVFQARATTILGGFISYECMGNGLYSFELVVYRNCQDAPININTVTLKLWNHPIVSSFTANKTSTDDISLLGTNVSGGTNCFDCSSPSNLGVGSIERLVFKSAPLELSGVPPSQGWIITCDAFSRPTNVDNLQNAQTQGITLTTSLFNVNNQNNLCNDNSPHFLQTPYFVGCVGQPFSLHLHPTDSLSDSLVYEFSQPLAKMNSGIYSPNENPPYVEFANNFSLTSPTPSTTINSSNQNATLDPYTGEITFLSQAIGNFNLKISIKTFRSFQLISEVNYELVVSVVGCVSGNSVPTITPPFSGSFETVAIVGGQVNFTLASSDVEVHPNGLPQKNTIIISSELFGPAPSSNTGCAVTPCPTLTPMMPIVGTQGASAYFKWQTHCDHLLDVYGNARDSVTYNFVVRVQDDFCPIPEVVYRTVSIKIINKGVIQAPKINCIQGVDSTGFLIDWQSVIDTTSTFVSYQVHSVQSGLIATISDINTTSYLHTPITDGEDYFIAVVSGCDGKAIRYSDTISGIFLDLNNDNLGIAILNWNSPSNIVPSSTHPMFYIHREYPSGTWTVIDSVPWSTTSYSEFISICDTLLSYRVSANNIPCNYISTIREKQFSDQTAPDIPILTSVSIDTNTNQTTISWTAPSQPDTYGYIVYMQDVASNFLVELDTIYGKTNTSYTYMEPYTKGPVTYTVAAFDSCPSPFGQPFNLSARDPNFHTTIYVQSHQQICDNFLTIQWNKYGGWIADSYDVFIQKQGETWNLVHTTDQLEYLFTGEGLKIYKIVIRANRSDGTFSFSNIISVLVQQQNLPSFSIIRSASVHEDNKRIVIDYAHDTTAIITKIELQRKNNNGVFTTIQTVNQPQSPHIFTDENVYPNEHSYTYRIIFYDSCGNLGYASNIATTILLKAQIENTSLLTYLFWSPYEQFSGDVANYTVLRSTDNSPMDSLTSVQPYLRSLEENIYTIDTEGLICYRVRANETGNIFDDPQVSLSNSACVLIEPIIYIPNSFYPDGKNTTFAPILRNYKLTSYKMTIINRWGQSVFQTQDPLEGWNGKIDNTKADAENTTYMYIIEIYNGNGEQVVTRGHVTLLR